MSLSGNIAVAQRSTGRLRRAPTMPSSFSAFMSEILPNRRSAMENNGQSSGE